VRKLKTQKSDEKLERLKALLLAPELETLRETVEALRKLQLHCDDPDAVVARVKPVFDTVLAKNLADKDSRTVELIAEYLADIIHEATEKDLPSLSRSLQHVIGPAIAKEIADNRETMVDTLYPIMGGMISKYVTQAIKELMENINRKIEDGLSTERIKRKIKAKLTGVSETELLLEESADARILALFIIHKPTGLLISSAQLDENVIDDPHMVAAMASAVKDFINDAVHLQKEFKEEVQIVSYADATLYIESAGSVYLIAFLDNEPDYEQRGEINAFFADIVKRYATFFQHFDGDESHKEVKELNEKLAAFLSAKTNVKKEKNDAGVNPAKWIFVALGIFAAAYFLYGAWSRYRIHQWEKEAEREGIRNARLVDINASAYRLEGYTDDAHTIERARTTLEHLTHRSVLPAVWLSPEALKRENHALEMRLARRIAEASDSLRQLSSTNETQKKRFEKEIARLRERNEALEKRVERLRTQQARLLEKLRMPQRIKAALDEAFKTTPYYRKDKGRLDFASLDMFAPHDTEVRTGAQKPFIKTARRYFETLCRFEPYIDTVEIAAYSDTSGPAEKNLALTQARAQNAKRLLVRNDATVCFTPDKIRAVGYGERFPVIVDGKEDANASRRIEIGYRLAKPSEE
jgi:outer membrane protein OmpA-like peptidoglycan-associated protein